MFQAEIHFRGLRTLRTLFSTAHGKSKRGLKKGLERKRAEGISLRSVRTVRSPESSSEVIFYNCVPPPRVGSSSVFTSPERAERVSG